MKLRRILAASTAAVIAAAAMSVVSFADAEVAFSNSVTVTSTGNWWDQADLTMEQVFGDVDPEDVTKVVVTVDNAASVQWNNSAKEYQKVDAKAGDKVEITDFNIDEDDGFFFSMAVSSNDTSYKATFSWDVYAEVAAVEDPVVDEPVADEPIAEEPVDDETPDVIAPAPDDTETGAIEIDWTQYDAEAKQAMNEEFVFGTTTDIDLYALLGDNWADLAKIEGTFVWSDLEAGWCGGGGIGGGAVAADGSTWISGPEYGAANANADLVGLGTATQTIVDITENPLTAIATVDEETGETSFGVLMVQNWWNGVESGAQVAAITAYDADGNVIGEIKYDVATPESPVVDTDNTTDTGKDSVDTGVEGIAAVAGVVALAGVAVVASRKRK